jgi:chromosome partitioning protein
MGSILVVGGEKGGPGKTTVAVHLAALLKAAGADVLLVNTDKQNTAGKWAAQRQELHPDRPAIPTISLHGKGVPGELRQQAGRYDVVIVDAAGRDSVEQRLALTVANHMIAPLLPSQFDAWTLEDVAEVVAGARAYNPDLRVSLFGSRIPAVSRDQAARQLRSMIEDVPADWRFDLLDAMIMARAAFQHATAEGLTVEEMPRRDPKACHEMRMLFEEVFDA